MTDSPEPLETDSPEPLETDSPEPLEIVFLGANNVGLRIYEWLCNRESVTVRAMLTRKDQLDLVTRLEPDLVVAVGFRHIVPPEILSVPRFGCLNLHPGLLPYARGFNPNVWSIVDGLPAGVTLHYMNEGIDAGTVVATREVKTTFADTGKDLYERLETAAFELFVHTWPSIEAGEVELRPQDDAESTMHYKRDFVELCELDPDATYTVRELLDTLRALTFPPFENAFVEINGERYYLELTITPESETTEDALLGTLASY